MSEKVVITQGQVDAIEYLISHNIYSEKELIRAHAKHHEGWDNEAKPLKDMDLLLLVDALRIGYEVEPEFKENDWIFHKPTGRVAQVDYRYDGEDELWVDDEEYNFFHINDSRHATPSEITEEKERRWWSSHGRELREVRNGDLLNNTESCQLFTINYLPLSYDEREDLRIGKIKVVCFAENRLDVKTNE